MASRYPHANTNSNLHQRDPRSALFGEYDTTTNSNNHNHNNPSSNNSKHRTASKPSYGYGVQDQRYGSGDDVGDGRYRVATPNRKGQYSDAVLNELESQNDNEVEGILGKVAMLKSMTISIGDEIRSSTALTEKMNDSFDGARVRLRGTMNRMLVMAERTGVGWRVWVGFFLAVGLVFGYVWLF